ncbi:flavin reductase family protein [Sphingomonas sp. ABOLD]|uniref:Flavin reductase (DIM6/NTAB) family NADH-FMN oxidoreductase RutF n=1 Tax=Sphingomonas trueperi TaxID=53317 RepID=A0A7X6BAL5_9SPHN|nr:MULTISPECIES: flavin reductase family protein [Sphingomonas]NJB96019.1 flavin reductase (DIM6/NTAB) family NADH-FMN oxidoreductase RutF [Sphingomonas trueperi]RSV44802.1 flavin reductase family protein [Sphingomonas sp. ABOLE]RSV47745.1 flavin reductase family protein [Sphingomonas sp. ABOLD]
MPTDFHFYEPASGHGLPHDPLNAIVGPRPIGWVSTMSTGGVRNLAPYSFFNLFNYRPPILGFASTGWKDSVANIAETREFVWNLATRPLAEVMNASAAMVDAEVDEFTLAGIDTLPSRTVRPDRVAGSPAQFECRLTQLIRLETKEGAEVDTWLVLGEATGIHIDRAMLEDGVYQTARARPILRGGGPADYFEIGEDALFRMFRPR